MLFIYPVSVFICLVFFSLFLLKKEIRLHNVILSGYFLVRAFDLMYGWIVFEGKYENYSSLIWVLFGSSILKSTLLFLYISLITQTVLLKGYKWIYIFSPLLLKYIIVFTCIILYSGETIHAITYNLWCGKLFYYYTIVTVIVFLYSAIILIRKYHQKLKDLTSNTNKFSLKWLITLIFTEIIMYLFVISVRLIDITVVYDSINYYPVLDGIDFILVLILGIMAYRQGIINYPTQLMDETEKKTTVSSKPVNYPDTGVVEMLESYLDIHKPYLEPELTIGQLAKTLNIPVNTLSRTINSYYQKTFFDLINEYRINEVTERLKEPSNQKYTILYLAYECGFNSKTTFYRVFKKLKGKTPSEYFRS